METVLNFTPHPINIIGADGEEIKTIEPSGPAIRLKATTAPAGAHAGIKLTKTIFGEPEGLPEAIDGTLIIVSQLVKTALPDRKALIVPTEVVRDDQGRIIGCKSLGI
jgi:hypothetical protein